MAPKYAAAIAAQDIVQPTLNVEATDGTSPPYVPPERPAAEPPRPAAAAATRAPSQFATRETAPTPRAPAAAPAPAPAGPGFFQSVDGFLRRPRAPARCL